ncbi:MAG: zinc-dependent peptidase [Spirochaetes bacterium]|nr:zinc-dependent peptidase [Spirochaetota bacterium]
MNSILYASLIIASITGTLSVVIYVLFFKPMRNIKYILLQPFPENLRQILNSRIKFYYALTPENKNSFEKRIQLFLATKKIIPVDTEIDDEIRIMIAASAIIPMFAFPGYNYPDLNDILVYPKSFDENFQTEDADENDNNIIGMVGNRYLNGTMIISKPDLINAYSGKNQKSNVGIHEFVHLVDKTDGAIDGIPEILLEHSYVAPWLSLIKEEMSVIEKGRSDINPYALTSDAEFLAVVSEYFFNDTENFKRKHSQLYDYLKSIFKQEI